MRVLLFVFSILTAAVCGALAHAQDMDCSTIQSDVYRFHCEEAQLQKRLKRGDATSPAPWAPPAARETIRRGRATPAPNPDAAESRPAPRAKTPRAPVPANRDAILDAEDDEYYIPPSERRVPPRRARRTYSDDEDSRTEAGYRDARQTCATCGGYRDAARLDRLPIEPIASAVRGGDTSSCSRPPPKSPKRIIIGFDGLGGYSAINKGLMSSGSSMFVPFGGSVIRNYIKPAVDRDPKNTHWEYFHHLSSSPASSAAMRCVQALATTGYRARDGRIMYPTVTIVGHSFGGAAAADLVAKLNRLGIAVDLVVTADARARDGNNNFRNNTRMNGRWLNFEQQNDFLPGYSVAGASNYNLSSQGAFHMTIPGHATSQYHFSRNMNALPPCKPSFSVPVQQRSYRSCPVD